MNMKTNPIDSQNKCQPISNPEYLVEAYHCKAWYTMKLLWFFQGPNNLQNNEWI